MGIGTGVTLAKALAELSDATEAMIVLVIDEAQHALTTKAGEATLFALKAARDQLNGSAHFGFRLIATGSNRDKLSLLVQGKDQPFLNAVLFDLPYLNEHYLAWELSQYEEVVKPSLTVLSDAFKASGYKPESIRKSLDDLAFRFEVTENNVDIIFQEIVASKLNEGKQIFLQQLNSLPPLQAAVMTVIALTGSAFAPYRPQTMLMYKDICGRISHGPVKMEDTDVQYALEALRDKTLIWNSARGVYAIEDSQHVFWLKNQFANIPLDDNPLIKVNPA